MTSIAPVSVVLAARGPDRVENLEPLCANDPELFWPVSESGPALLQITRAKELCRRCPHLSPCLELALESGEEEGVWGATTGSERRRLLDTRRRRTISAAEVA